MQKLLLAISLLLCNALLFGDTTLKNVSYEDALKVANEDNKTIMIKMTAQHCKYCKRMDKNVLSDEEVISTIVKDFVSVEIDVDKEKIPLDLNRTMTPTFIFVNKDEKIIKKVVGSWNKKDFLDILNLVIKKSKGE